MGAPEQERRSVADANQPSESNECNGQPTLPVQASSRPASRPVSPPSSPPAGSGAFATVSMPAVAQLQAAVSTMPLLSQTMPVVPVAGLHQPVNSRLTQSAFFG